METDEIVNISFALDIKSDWPPVATESVWCRRQNGNYVLRNAPFFISGLAHGDELSATPDPVNGCVFEFKVVAESGRSVVWAMNNVKLDTKPFIAELKLLNCLVEGFPQFSLLSIDVPPDVDVSAFDALVHTWEKRGLNFAFPTWRHAE